MNAMLRNRRRSSILAAPARRGLLLMAAALILSTHATAQRSSRRLLRDSSEILAKLDPTTTRASRSLCVLRKGRDACAYGLVVHPDGWLVTKYSEIDPASLSCELPDGRQVRARVSAVDRLHDLALLKVDAKDLSAVRWSTRPLPVGSLVVTSGPRARAVAMGVVSGPVRELEAGRPMLGVELDQNEPRIVRIVRGTAAQRIGLRARDVIVEVNHKEVSSREELVGELQELRVGDMVELVVLREGEEIDFQTTLGSWEEEGAMDGDKSRVRSGFPEVFRHDCVLEPEECGGPIVDLEGNVVGINIARAGRTASYAIPGATAQAVIRKLLRKAGRESVTTRRSDHNDD